MLEITQEIWKDVVGYEGLYKVSSLGRVKGPKGSVLKPWRINSGYNVVSLHREGNGSKRLVHRLVAEAFVPNPNSEKTVNHKDFDKSNNKAANLEWLSQKANNQASKKAGRMPYNTPGLGKKRKGRKSKYHNVSYDKSRGKWIAYVSVNWRKVGFKRFDNEIDAAKHVNFLIKTHNLKGRPKNNV